MNVVYVMQSAKQIEKNEDKGELGDFFCFFLFELHLQ